MKKIMISQPMFNKTNDEINKIKKEAANEIESMGYEVINTFFIDEYNNKENIFNVPLFFLSKALEKMSFCDAVYFCAGWENARGCRIEHDVAKAYGLEIIYERI